MTDEPAPPASVEEAASASIRTTAQWLITTLGAVAAVVVAGLSLEGLGDLSLGWKIAAIAGLAVALAGVALAVLGMSRVLEPATPTLGEIQASTDPRVVELRTSPARLAPYASFDTFVQRFDDARIAYATALDRGQNVDVARSAWQGHERRARRFSEEAAYLVVARRFENARTALWWQGLLVVTGVVAIALALPAGDGGGSDADAGTFDPPLLASVVLDADDREALELGPDCTADELEVVVLGGTREAPDVLSVPTEDCAARRFVAASERVGEVRYP